MVATKEHQTSIPESYPQKWPKAVIFDWDNTLVDTWRVCYEALNHTCHTLQFPLVSLEDFYNQPHLSVKDSFPQRFGEEATTAEACFYQYLRKEHLNSLRPMPGAEKLLQILKGKEVYLGIVSNKQGDYLREEVRHLGWEHYFEKVIGSRDTPEDKPSALPLLTLLQDSPHEAGHDVWFVGDSAVDTLCARNAGCVPVAVGPSALMEEVPTILGKDCLGLANILMRL